MEVLHRAFRNILFLPSAIQHCLCISLAKIWIVPSILRSWSFASTSRVPLNNVISSSHADFQELPRVNRGRGLFHTTVGGSLDVFKIGKYLHLTFVFLGVIAFAVISIFSPSMGSSLFLVDLHRRSKKITTPVAITINTRPPVAENGTTYQVVFFAVFPTCTAGEKQNCSQCQNLESVPAFLSLTCDQAFFFFRRGGGGDSAKEKWKKDRLIAG